jgi:hypothetical protein
VAQAKAGKEKKASTISKVETIIANWKRHLKVEGFHSPLIRCNTRVRAGW